MSDDILEPLMQEILKVDAKTRLTPRLVWAEVTDVARLRVRFEGASKSVDASSVASFGLRAGDRVLAVLYESRTIVLGLAKGFQDLILPGDLTVNGETVLAGRTVMPGNTFASMSALNSWQPSDGAIAFLQSDGRHYERVDGAWRTIQARHTRENSAGRAYFVAEGGGSWTDSYLGLEAAGATDRGFWYGHQNSIKFIVYPDGSARVYGDLQVDGSVTQAGDTNWATVSPTLGSGSISWICRNGLVEVRWAGTGSYPTGYSALYTGLIPPAYRPSANIRGSAAMNADASAGLTVLTAGTVGIYNSTGAVRTGGEGSCFYHI